MSRFLGLTRMGLICVWGWCAASGAWAQVDLRAELARPLQAAQEALKTNQAAQALTLLTQARAVPALTASERVLVERLTAAAALSAQQYPQAISALDFLVQSPDVPVADKLTLLESLVHASQRTKDYPHLVAAARQYLAAGGSNATIRLMMVQSLSVLGQHDQVVREVQALLAREPLTPALSEAELRLLAASHKQLKNEAGYYAALKLLVARYPTPDYWIDVVSRVQRQPGFNTRLELDTYRLLEAVGGLDEADDLLYMSSLALKAGLPAEALRLLDQGFASKVLGNGPDAAQHTKLRQQAAQRVAEDDKALAALEAATDSTARAQLGDVLASKSQWERANTAYAQALAQGGVKREVELRLHYGVSLLKANKGQDARAMLGSVHDDPSAVELASLWILRLK